ncbi:CD209 antigen-like protein C isoform X2 [Vanacampus margaritifer]
MPEGDVLYSDLVFSKSRANRGKDAASSAPETNYALVKVSETQSEPVQDPGAKPARSKLTSERAALAALCILLVLTFVALCFVSYQNVQSRNRLHNLTAEFETCRASRSDGANGDCRKCYGDWVLHGESCYLFTSINLTWERSRRFCENLNGNLVKIDSREEQSFVEAQLRNKMAFQEDKFWIGLTDSEQEDRWLWTDGSLLHPSLTFWSPNEPDNWSGEGSRDGEDCVRIGEKDGAEDLLCWFDKACNAQHRSICEMAAQRGRLDCLNY